MSEILKQYALKLFHSLPDGIKLFLRSFKKQEPELYELIWLVEKSTIVVDIGANNGAYTYALSRLVGKDGLVIAIEPIIHLANYLRRACRQLRLPVQVKQICLSSKNERTDLLIPCSFTGELLTGFANLGNRDSQKHIYTHKQIVDIKRLDDILRERRKRVSFIKCDVEGHEFEVLKGGVNILKTDRPNLLIEIEQRHNFVSINEIFEFLKTLKYKGYFIDSNGKLRILKEFSIFTHQSYPLKNPSNEYIFNFIFLPVESPDAEILRNWKRLQ